MSRRSDWTTKRWIAVAGLTLGGVVMSTSSLACSVVGIRSGYEEYGHQVVAADGRFEVRQYDDCIVATTSMSGSMSEVAGASFNRLGGYIFGDNVKDEGIAMTVPVLRQQPAEPESESIAMTVPVVRNENADGSWEMTFVLPSEYTMESLPRPTDPNVKLERRPGQTRAAYRYSGLQDEADLALFAPDLIAWVEAQGYRVISRPFLAAYDPPWTIPFLRRNEVLVDIEPVERARAE